MTGTLEAQRRFILVASTLLASWLGMQQVHELGHVLGAWLTGGRVERVAFPLLGFSRTELARNPQPLVVAWAGPLTGAILPLAIWGAARQACYSGEFLFRFFAGFCLLANGLYLGVGSFDKVGDCGDLLRHGAAIWQLWLFGLAAAPAGLWIWHGLAANFGWGPAPRPIPRESLFGVLTACLLLVLIAFLAGGE